MRGYDTRNVPPQLRFLPVVPLRLISPALYVQVASVVCPVAVDDSSSHWGDLVSPSAPTSYGNQVSLSKRLSSALLFGLDVVAGFGTRLLDIILMGVFNFRIMLTTSLRVE